MFRIGLARAAVPHPPPVGGRRGGRCAAAAVAALLTVAIAPGDRRPPAGDRVPAAAAAPGDPVPPFGLAHVDLMDLHVARDPSGAVRPAERLPAADLSDRYARAGASGAGWNRWSLYWDMVESRQGSLDWSVADAIADRDAAAGLRTLAILQGTPPHFATGGDRTAAVPAVGGLAARFGPLAAAGGPAMPRAAGRPPVQASPPAGMERPIFRRADGGLTDDPDAAVAVNPDNPWARFVDAAVVRYRPGGDLARARGWPDGVGVRAWEIGNEPNLAHFWSGSPTQYVRYLEVASLAIHRRDPGAIVLHGGIADDAGAGAWYGQFLDALKARAAASPLPARHDHYFDKAAWHWYTYPSLLQTGPARARALLTDRGLAARPVWVTEMGAPIWSEHPGPCWDPVSPWRATVAEQAGYLWQALTEGRAAGVEVMVVFQLYDDCGNGPTSYDAFGLVRNHAANQCWAVPDGQSCWRLDPTRAGTPRPGYEALRVAAAALAGTELLWRPPREADFWQRVLLYQPPDRRVMVLWNLLRADRTVEVYGTGREAEVLTLGADGRLDRRAATPTAGRHTLTLPGATNRNNPGNQAAVMAGRPVIVIERDTSGPFRAQVEPLPVESPARFTLTVAAADGGTGVGAFRVYQAVDAPPAQPAEWRVLVDAVPWTADPLSGSAEVSFDGLAGRTYYFAAQARDRAGNWSAIPREPQAWTRVVGDAPTPGPPTAAPTPALTPTAPAPTPEHATDTPPPPRDPTATVPSVPSVTPSAPPNAPPTADATAGAATPTPTLGPTSPAPPAARIILPIALAGSWPPPAPGAFDPGHPNDGLPGPPVAARGFRRH